MSDQPSDREPTPAEWTAADWDADWAGGTGGDGHPDAFLVAQFADLTPGRALDLGCGAGVHVLWLAQHGWRALGVDWAKTAIQQARAKAESSGITGAEFQVQDTTTWTPDEQ